MNGVIVRVAAHALAIEGNLGRDRKDSVYYSTFFWKSVTARLLSEPCRCEHGEPVSYVIVVIAQTELA